MTCVVNIYKNLIVCHIYHAVLKESRDLKRLIYSSACRISKNILKYYFERKIFRKRLINPFYSKKIKVLSLIKNYKNLSKIIILIKIISI